MAAIQPLMKFAFYWMKLISSTTSTANRMNEETERMYVIIDLTINHALANTYVFLCNL
jgi:hypothetical protein